MVTKVDFLDRDVRCGGRSIGSLKMKIIVKDFSSTCQFQEEARETLIMSFELVRLECASTAGLPGVGGKMVTEESGCLAANT